MTRILVIALVAIGCWTLSAFLAWLWVTAAMRRDDDEPDDADDIQPWDMPTSWSFVAGPSVTVTPDDQSETSAGRLN